MKKKKKPRGEKKKTRGEKGGFMRGGREHKKASFLPAWRKSNNDGTWAPKFWR